MNFILPEILAFQPVTQINRGSFITVCFAIKDFSKFSPFRMDATSISASEPVEVTMATTSFEIHMFRGRPPKEEMSMEVT